MTDPLFSLGSLAARLKHYAAAESYFQRALDINLKIFGENSTRTSESLRAMAGLYMAQSDWSKAEPYLLRAVKGSEAAAGPDDNMVLVPLWGMCDLYDRWGKPQNSQPCWHRATELMEKQVGVNSPDLGTSLTNEANALRLLGRTSEADHLVQRFAKIQLTASQMK
jgi:tetratricopeptide (TPR) repeat protein